MIRQVRHRTVYQYSEPVGLSHHLAHLAPRSSTRQRRLCFELVIHPAPRLIDHGLDYFGNETSFFELDTPHDRLRVDALSTVEVVPPPALDLQAGPGWEATAARLAEDPELTAVAEFTTPSSHVPAVAAVVDYARPSFPPGRPLRAAVRDLVARIHRDFRFDATATSIATPIAEVLAERHGVCQDFAHLAIGCLRGLGLAARYVSGYIETTPPPGQPRLAGADASHAWVAVYCPEAGWVEADPTNDLMPVDRHVVVGWGRDFADVSPLKGVILGGGWQTVDVAVDVTADDTAGDMEGG